MTYGKTMGMEPLYALALEAMTLSRAILESGGEITPEIDALLVVNETSLAQKSDAYAAVLDRLEVEEGLWRKRRDECLKILRAHEELQDRLKARMKEALVAMGRDEVRGDQVRFKLAKAQPKLILGNDLPQDCYMPVTTLEVDKQRVRERLEAGEVIVGAALVPNFSLRRCLNRKES